MRNYIALALTSLAACTNAPAKETAAASTPSVAPTVTVPAIDLTSIDHHGCRAPPVFAGSVEFLRVLLLPSAQLSYRGPRQLAPVVSARSRERSVFRGRVKQHDDAANAVQVDQISALASKLLGAQKVSPTGSERSGAARDIEPVIPGDVKMV
jgi:hypothetical protein